MSRVCYVYAVLRVCCVACMLCCVYAVLRVCHVHAVSRACCVVCMMCHVHAVLRVCYVYVTCMLCCVHVRPASLENVSKKVCGYAGMVYEVMVHGVMVLWCYGVYVWCMVYMYVHGVMV